jgi:hypothetical protein
VTLPPLDDAARQRASRSAVDARRTRADWKSRLASGAVGLDELLEAARRDAAVAGMRVTEALAALPGVGPRGVERILETCAIAPSRRIRGLGPRQRAALLDGPWARRARP